VAVNTSPRALLSRHSPRADKGTESSMLRHFHLFVAAPGRQDEAERGLRQWLAEASQAPQFRGGAVLREYASEFGEVRGALAVIYDVESREAGKAFRDATAGVANPMAQDIPGQEPPDQGSILFDSADHPHDGHAHAHGDDHSHVPAHAADALDFNRGGGLLARLMHGHFEILAQADSATDLVAQRA
jgi:hypothetical protein